MSENSVWIQLSLGMAGLHFFYITAIMVKARYSDYRNSGIISIKHFKRP